MRKFKYQINHFLSIQPRNISIDNLSILLRREHDIPFSVFDRDRYSRDGESYEIPEDRLKVYAKLLDVSVESLVEECEDHYGILTV